MQTWSELVEAVDTTRAAYEALGAVDLRKGEAEYEEGTSLSNDLLRAHDYTVVCAMARRAENAEQMRWKLKKLHEIYSDDNSWESLDNLLPLVLEDAQRFIRD